MIAVIQFPGSNDDRDMLFAMKTILGAEASLIWHQETVLPAKTEIVLLPGGFSYGDYLRCGAMARFSPVMGAVQRFADAGGFVLGTCNGFQVLCESGLLPGILLRNRKLHFLCQNTAVRVERSDTIFTSRTKPGEVLWIPIKHGEGAYYADTKQMQRLEDNGQILLRYCDAEGSVTEDANPNGSLHNIAGIVNERGNVFGLMPHPEHAVEEGIGGTDGLKILGSLLDAALARRKA